MLATSSEVLGRAGVLRSTTVQGQTIEGELNLGEYGTAHLDGTTCGPGVGLTRAIFLTRGS